MVQCYRVRRAPSRRAGACAGGAGVWPAGEVRTLHPDRATGCTIHRRPSRRSHRCIVSRSEPVTIKFLCARPDNVCAWAGRAGWRAMRAPERYLCPHRPRGTLGSFRAPIKQCGAAAQRVHDTGARRRLGVFVLVVVGYRGRGVNLHSRSSLDRAGSSIFVAAKLRSFLLGGASSHRLPTFAKHGTAVHSIPSRGSARAGRRFQRGRAAPPLRAPAPIATAR